MAIPIEGYTVVAQRVRIQHLLDEQKVPSPNAAVLADDHLWRCSFMTHHDAAHFAKSLESLGLNISQGPDSDVVLVNEFDLAIDPYCEWLLTGHWEKAVIAWLAGTEPRTVSARDGWDPKIGSGLTFRTSTEGLEFVQLKEDNVEVFRDKATGQLLYVGRTSAPTGSLFKSAADIIRKHFHVAGQPPVTGSDASDVKRAIEMLDKILPEAPDNWQAHWFHGKGHLAIGNLTPAYESFHRAYALEKNEEAIPRELGGTCLALGKFDEALQLNERAVAMHPDNHELLGNLALAHLLAGNIEAAQRSIKAAQTIEPNDTINIHLSTIIDEVATGRRPQPKSMDYLQRQPRPKQNSRAQLQPARQESKKKFWQFWKNE
jgi:Flp pilus assembly protein TadD